jgi:hypothetical protein
MDGQNEPQTSITRNSGELMLAVTNLDQTGI